MLVGKETEYRTLRVLYYYLAHAPRLHILRMLYRSSVITDLLKLTNSMTYGTLRFNAAFTRALQ